MIIKKLFLSILAFPLCLYGMQVEQYHRFPDYSYYQPHPESQPAGGDFCREALQINCHLYNSGIIPLKKDSLEDMKNFIMTLYITQAALLTKPIQSWTVDDIQKVNALVIDYDSMAAMGCWHEGLFRARHIFFTKYKPSDEMHPVIADQLRRINAKIHGIGTLAQIRQLLSAQEWDLLNTYFSPCLYEYTELPALMSNFMVQLRAMAEEKGDPIKLAAFAHERITGIHPFLDANGRTARIISFLILMKAHRVPYIMWDFDEFYTQIAESSHQDIRALEFYLRESVKATEIKRGANCFDLNGVPCTKPLDEEEIKTVKELYESINVADREQMKAALKRIKHYAASKINFMNESCQKCGKEANLKKCSGCKFIRYCSQECQKNDWTRHKLKCSALKQSLSEENIEAVRRQAQAVMLGEKIA